MDELCKQAAQSVDDGYNYIILSDRGVDETHAAIPSLLAVSAVHHYLIDAGKRVQTALIVESGEIREIIHVSSPSMLRLHETDFLPRRNRKPELSDNAVRIHESHAVVAAVLAVVPVVAEHKVLSLPRP